MLAALPAGAGTVTVINESNATSFQVKATLNQVRDGKWGLAAGFGSRRELLRDWTRQPPAGIFAKSRNLSADFPNGYISQ